MLEVLAEMAAWAEAQAGGAGNGRQLRQAETLNPPLDVRALLRSIEELHFLDVGLNCRGAYLTGEPSTKP